MPRQLIFTLEDNGTYSLTAPSDFIEALGLHAMCGDAIRIRQAQAQQQRKIEVPQIDFPQVGGNVSPFGRK